jgi:serine/threonine protein kinase
MPAPTTTEDFLDLLRQSELVDDAMLTKRLGQINARTVWSDSPEQLANELVRQGILTSFHTANLLQGRWRGFYVDKYRLLEVIGAGGMGQVYLAEHKVMRRLVALKVLTLKPGADPSLLLRFQREARAAAALDHPNIVHAFDADHDGKNHFLVMEFVDGTSLSNLVKRRGPLPVGRAASYIHQAALGLQHAHEQGIVHRDIKPGNLLLDRQGVVRLLDMGLAKLYHDHADNLTLEHNGGQALGTADYLAPEQVINSAHVDPRADLYALGGTFYFLLTGQAPFALPTVAEKLTAHQTRTPAPVRHQRADVPAELELVLQQMLAKKPEQRYPSAAVIAEALERWADPVAPPPEGEIPLPGPAIRQLLQLHTPPPRPPASRQTHTVAQLAADKRADTPQAGNRAADDAQPTPKPTTAKAPTRTVTKVPAGLDLSAPALRVGYSALLAPAAAPAASEGSGLRQRLGMVLAAGLVLAGIVVGALGGVLFVRPTLPAAEQKEAPGKGKTTAERGSSAPR